MSSKNRPVVVTGVSSGIGRAIAEALVGAGIPVIGSVRRQADADAFVTALGSLATPLIFDIRDADAIAAAAREAAALAGPGGIAALVNNAGVAMPGPLEHLPVARFRDQLETNVIGVLAVTQAFLPLLKAAPATEPRRIVNISSVSGTVTYPFIAAYAAAKAALDAVSNGLRRELIVHGIDVVVVEPAGVRTPMWDKAAEEKWGDDIDPLYHRPLAAFREAALSAGRNGLLAAAIATLVHDIVTRRRVRPRYVVSQNPFTQRVIRMMPTRLLDRLIARRLGFPRR